MAEIVDAGDQAVVRLELADVHGRPVPVEGRFVRVPTLEGSPLYLATYRDLRRSRRDSLLREQSGALERLTGGGALHEVLAHLTRRAVHAAGGDRAWFALFDRVGDPQPVLWGHDDPELVRTTLAAAARLAPAPAADAVAAVPVDDLPVDVGRRLAGVGVGALWLVPVLGSDQRPRGLLAVALAEPAAPSPDECQLLGHLGRFAALAVERSQAQATLAHRDLHDPLTELPNRTLVMDRLEQAVARLGRGDGFLAVLLVDLDRFRLVNHVHGSLVADQVLVEVARRLRAEVRLGDTVGRLGGDQFVAVCVALADPGDVSALAERVIASIGRPIVVDGQEVVVTASVGVVLVAEPGRSASAVIASAETALHRAVADGRGRWAVYEEGSGQRIVVRHEVERALHLALTEAELLLHYQPVVELRSGRMVGAEALIRWDRPGHGLLAPAEFLDVAEETGLIVPLGHWAIDEVCRQLSRWPVDRAGRRPVVTVNLSARQLADVALVPTVLAALERHGVAAAHLGFEVTESVRVEDLEVASSSLQRLSALGCMLAIDDFGVGYATLDYLRRFSMAHALKIDRSFVSGLGTSHEDTAIVSASVALAKSLGLAVVAEGVEREEQLDELRALGIELAQGYAISPPVRIEQVLALWEVGRLVASPSAAD